MNDRNHSKIPFIKIPEHRTCLIDQLSRRKIIKNLEVTGNSDLIPQYTKSNSVPFRQYYHSRTNLPMHGDEWDYDSDDHPDDNWIHRISEEVHEHFHTMFSNQNSFFIQLLEYVILILTPLVIFLCIILTR